MCAAGHLLLIQPATQVARSPFPCALGRAERDPSRTTAFSLFLHSARRASYLFTKIHNKPRHRRETDTTHSNRSEFFSIRRPVRHRNFFSLSRRRNSPPYYRPSINTTVAALIPPAPLQMRINIKEQKKKIKRRRRKEKKEKIIKKKIKVAVLDHWSGGDGRVSPVIGV